MGRDLVQVYKAADGWRWRFLAAENGQVLADSGEGYARRVDALSAARRVTGAPIPTQGDEDES